MIFSVLIVLFFTILIFIFIYKNSLFYVISLLLVSFVVLSYVALHSYLSFLTVFMLIIVYVGAMMVLIGYICAISPNLILEPDFSQLSKLLAVLLCWFWLSNLPLPIVDIDSSTMVDYFYSFQGIHIFIILALMLFVTLLIVTSQYTVPNGPFRSISS